jgi:hypothetical protein
MQHAAGSRQIHDLLAQLPRFSAAFSALDLPKNGVYVFYEVGETFEDRDRIVRIGTHVGAGRLAKRLKLHYAGRARRSVFRRNVGNALVRAGLVEGISSNAAPFGSDQFGTELEKAISTRFAVTFTFSVVRIDEMSDRLRLEAGLIASLSSETAVPPSSNWLGHHSTVAAVRAYGLWNKNHVGGIPLSVTDLELLRQAI